MQINNKFTNTQMSRLFARFKYILMTMLIAACVVGCSSVSQSSAVETCFYQENPTTAKDENMDAGYYCHPLLKSGYSGKIAREDNVVLTSGCTFFASYIRNDGVQVGPYVRCKTASDMALYKSMTGVYEPSVCAHSYCGQVNVRGYYKKDGTYVRPYSRKK